jgi:hypothetical protein
MADFLEEKKKREIGRRLEELRPLVDEYQRLEAATAALDGVPGSAARRVAAEAPARRARRTARSGSRRRGRRRGSRTRSTQALELVRAQPASPSRRSRRRSASSRTTSIGCCPRCRRTGWCVRRTAAGIPVRRPDRRRSASAHVEPARSGGAILPPKGWFGVKYLYDSSVIQAAIECI